MRKTHDEEEEMRKEKMGERESETDDGERWDISRLYYNIYT